MRTQTFQKALLVLTLAVISASCATKNTIDEQAAANNWFRLNLECGVCEVESVGRRLAFISDRAGTKSGDDFEVVLLSDDFEPIQTSFLSYEKVKYQRPTFTDTTFSFISRAKKYTLPIPAGFSDGNLVRETIIEDVNVLDDGRITFLMRGPGKYSAFVWEPKSSRLRHFHTEDIPFESVMGSWLQSAVVDAVDEAITREVMKYNTKQLGKGIEEALSNGKGSSDVSFITTETTVNELRNFMKFAHDEVSGNFIMGFSHEVWTDDRSSSAARPTIYGTLKSAKTKVRIYRPNGTIIYQNGSEEVRERELAAQEGKFIKTVSSDKDLPRYGGLLLVGNGKAWVPPYGWDVTGHLLDMGTGEITYPRHPNRVIGAGLGRLFYSGGKEFPSVMFGKEGKPLAVDLNDGSVYISSE